MNGAKHRRRGTDRPSMATHFGNRHVQSLGRESLCVRCESAQGDRRYSPARLWHFFDPSGGCRAASGMKIPQEEDLMRDARDICDVVGPKRIGQTATSGREE